MKKPIICKAELSGNVCSIPDRKRIQREFLDKMLANLGDGELKAFLSALGVIKGNLNAILEEEDKK